MGIVACNEVHAGCRCAAGSKCTRVHPMWPHCQEASHAAHCTTAALAQHRILSPARARLRLLYMQPSRAATAASMLALTWKGDLPQDMAALAV